jgi:hypothetical protein
MLKKGAPDQGPLHLPSLGKMNASKWAVLGEAKRRKAHLRQVDVYLVATGAPAYMSAVNHWKIQLGGEKAVDA